MPRIDRAELIDFASALLARQGMEADKAVVTAEVLVEGDMIGHDTHGLQLMHWYLESLQDGSLNGKGSYQVVADKGAGFVWDGRLLPGAWLLTRALDQAVERAREYGIVGAAIRNSHHTCALSAYMRKGDGSGADRADFGVQSGGRAGGALWWNQAAADAKPDCDGLSHLGRSDPCRCLGLDHDDDDDTASREEG